MGVGAAAVITILALSNVSFASMLRNCLMCNPILLELIALLTVRTAIVHLDASGQIPLALHHRYLCGPSHPNDRPTPTRVSAHSL